MAFMTTTDAIRLKVEEALSSAVPALKTRGAESANLAFAMSVFVPFGAVTTWERQQLESQPQESLSTPTEGSHASTGSVATTTEIAEDGYIDNGGDNFNGLN
ncbi:predicted protein [Pyrenophora tritici-repentis Pt-1C-BFP]|uniref:Uncharacterized protein n=1 Tax=Pyrenophora tritici-repentis (strain Pt-1C-BFP) TaxID=426418 RepID=B2WPL9_PYRTR|nr:uncharacterized protein PTRG_11970 [Pyrenophora tritici-repentis Pt-1C-BFP]EDU46085.1 predicted protein [Pyrenophora tritici-repentis Pt-1C-BFP]